MISTRRFRSLLMLWWLSSSAFVQHLAAAQSRSFSVRQTECSTGSGWTRNAESARVVNASFRTETPNGTSSTWLSALEHGERSVGMLKFTFPSLPPVSFGQMPSLNAQIPSIPTIGYPCCMSCCTRDCCCCGCSTVPTPTLVQTPSQRQSDTPSTPSSQSRTVSAPPSPISRPTSTGFFCQSGRGIQVHWTWVDQAAGLVRWTFQNPTESQGVVVLTRGVLGSGWYAFGNAFWPAYLETGLTHIGTGPYAPIEGPVQNLPLALVGIRHPGVAFVFPIRGGATITVDEGGYAGSEPYCHELVDVNFIQNSAYQITYNVAFQCHDFAGTTRCPPDPYLNTFPVYAPIDGSLEGAFWPSAGDLILPAVVVRERAMLPRRGNCLSGEMQVRLRNGSMRALRELRVGEWIWTRAATEPHARLLTQVYGFADYEPEDYGVFYLRITTDHGTLELSADHLVAVKSPSDGQIKMVPACRLEVGSRLLVEALTTAIVVRIDQTTVHGALAPLTDTGTLLVNDHLVSCYSGRVSQVWAHLAFLPLRVYHRVKRYTASAWSIAPHAQTQTPPQPTFSRSGIHPYARFLIMICRALGPLCPARDAL